MTEPIRRSRTNTPLKKGLLKLESTLTHYFSNNPPAHLPDNAQRVMVKIIPWLVVSALVMTLPWLFLAITVGSSIGFVGSATASTLKPLYYVSVLTLLVVVIILMRALPGLFNRRASAWRLLYYATLINVVYAVFRWLSVPAAIFSFIWALFISLIALYILFQIRPHYR